MHAFVLVDCNNFYVSCEKLFNPKLEGQPVVVLSNNDGCVISRSPEAKKLGIKMGSPFFQIREFCAKHRVRVYSSNYSLYGNLSQRVMSVLQDNTDQLEIYSIDEAFLRYPEGIFDQMLFAKCQNLKKIVKKWTGIPISIGIGPTKTLAKMANHLAKKNPNNGGVYDLRSEVAQENILKEFLIKDIWGIGRGFYESLKSFGLHTAWQLRQADPILIRRRLGVVGERVLWELRGLCCLPLEEVNSKKTITFSRSFGKVVTALDELEEALATYSNKAGSKLRQQKSYAKALYIYLESFLNTKTGSTRCFNLAMDFPRPTNDTAEIISAVKRCLKAIFRKGEKYKKCGVVLLDLISENQISQDLFLDTMDSKRQRLLQTIDEINGNFGKNTIFYGAMGVNPKWKMRSDKRSPCYTTSWKDLAVAKA